MWPDSCIAWKEDAGARFSVDENEELLGHARGCEVHATRLPASDETRGLSAGFYGCPEQLSVASRQGEVVEQVLVVPEVAHVLDRLVERDLRDRVRCRGDVGPGARHTQHRSC